MEREKQKMFANNQSDYTSNQGDMEGDRNDVIGNPVTVKIKPPKSIVQQVRNLDWTSNLIKFQSNEILNRIIATLTSWELFSDLQIIDAINALKILYQTINFCQEQQLPIIKSITTYQRIK